MYKKDSGIISNKNFLTLLRAKNENKKLLVILDFFCFSFLKCCFKNRYTIILHSSHTVSLDICRDGETD